MSDEAPKPHAPMGPIRRRDPMPAENRMCGAHSKQTGKPCGRRAIPGGTVCRWHGGAAPQVKAAAMERLMALQHPAIDRLTQLIGQKEFPTVAYAASRDVLDRTLGKAKEELKVTATIDIIGVLRKRHARNSQSE